MLLHLPPPPPQAVGHMAQMVQPITRSRSEHDLYMFVRILCVEVVKLCVWTMHVCVFGFDAADFVSLRVVVRVLVMGVAFFV